MKTVIIQEPRRRRVIIRFNLIRNFVHFDVNIQQYIGHCVDRPHPMKDGKPPTIPRGANY